MTLLALLLSTYCICTSVRSSSTLKHLIYVRPQRRLSTQPVSVVDHGVIRFCTVSATKAVCGTKTASRGRCISCRMLRAGNFGQRRQARRQFHRQAPGLGGAHA